MRWPQGDAADTMQLRTWPHSRCGAGIYVEKIVGFIKDKKKQISKSFTLYAVEGGGSGGIVTLKLVRCGNAPPGTPAAAGAHPPLRRTSFPRGPPRRWAWPCLLRRRQVRWTWGSTRRLLWTPATTT